VGVNRTMLVAAGLLLAAGLYATIDGRSRCEVKDPGAALYLTRASGTTTFRALFCHAQDCDLVAAQMSKAEGARWSCH
jgi:hypothetical protein